MTAAPRARAPASVGTPLRVTFLILALIIIAPFTALIAYMSYAQLSDARSWVQRDALSQARSLASRIEVHVAARLDALTAAAETLATNPGAGEGVLRRLKQSFPDLGQVVVVDSLGLAVSATGVGEGRRLALGDQEWFKRAATSTQAFAGPPRRVGPEIVVGLYAAGRTPEGQLRAVVAADLGTRRIQEMLGQARAEARGVAEVLSDQGVVLARQPEVDLLGDARRRTGYVELPRGQEYTGDLVFGEGEKRPAGAAPVRSVAWTVAVGLPDPPSAYGILLQIAAATAVVALLAIVLVFSVSNRTIKAMDRLRTAMVRLETGDVPASIPVAVGGEVGALTEGFNRMLGWLHSRVKEFEAVSRVEEAAGAAIAGQRSVGAVLPDLLRRVVAGMGADAGVVVTADGEELTTRAAVGFGSVQAEGVELRRGRSFAGEVMRGRGPTAVENVDTDMRVDEPYLRGAGLRSIVGVPLALGERVLGAIVVGYRGSRNLTEPELQRLDTLARRLAQAIERDRAMEEVRQNTAGLEAKLAEQLDALQQAALEQAEARRQALEARRQTQELERKIKSQPVPVKEVVREDPAAEETRRIRAAMQRTVSEELRVPLTALLELPRFLIDGLDKPLSPEERLQLELLHARGEEILELIDNLVILSALHAGQVNIARATVNVGQLVQRVVRALGPRAAAKGNRIDVDVKGEVGEIVTDGRRLEEALSNLIATSIKYTEVGEIRVSCYARDASVVVTVADDGVGFTDGEQERIFEPFLQVAPRNDRTLPGTGLLLTVCQRLVQALGGKIRVESEVDRGTWFTVSLPVQS